MKQGPVPELGEGHPSPAVTTLWGKSEVCWSPWGNNQSCVFWEKSDLAMTGAGIHEPPAGPVTHVKRKSSVAGAGRWDLCPCKGHREASLLGNG